MAVSIAALGYGSTFAVEDAPGSGSFIELAEITTLTAPDLQTDQVEVTHMLSPDRVKEFVQGLADLGSVELALNYVPSSATDDFILAWRLSGDRRACQITYPAIGAEVVVDTFPGFILSYGPSLPVAERATATLSLKVAGAVVRTRPTLLERLLMISGLVSAYDARDTSSLSNTAAGSPVTAVGDKIASGDRAFGDYVAGLPNIATATGLPVTIIRDAGTSQTLTIYSGLVAGRRYALTWAGSHNSGFGSFRVANGNDATKYEPAGLSTSAGPGTYYFRAVASGALVVSGDAPGWSCTINAVSLSEIGGNLLVQSTSSLRPLLGGYPAFDFDGVDDVLNFRSEVALGSSCAIYTFNTATETHTWLTGQTLNAGLNAMPTGDWGRAAIFSSEPTEGQKSIVQAWGAGVKVPLLADGYLAFEAVFTDNAPVSVQSAIRDPLGLVDITSSLIDNGDGTFGLTKLADFYQAKAVTVELEYTIPDFDGQGVPFGWYSVSPNQFFFTVNTSATNSRPMYYRLNANSYATPRFKHPDDGEIIPCLGRNKVVLALQEGVAPRGIANNFIPQAETIQPVMPALGTPTKFTFFKNGIPGGIASPMANMKVNAVRIWVGAQDNDFLDTRGSTGICEPIHLIGDSFLNGGTIRQAIVRHYDDVGYVPNSQDQVGGSTLPNQLVRMQAYPSRGFEKWFDSTLIILDGGLSEHGDVSVPTIASMAALLTHGRWIYVEPGPNRDATIGTSKRTGWDADVAAIRAAYPSRYVDTLAPLLNTNPLAGTIYHDGSTADLDSIAAGIWPRSLCLSDIDFHPASTVNGAGWSGVTALGQIIYEAMVLRGYLPS